MRHARRPDLLHAAVLLLLGCALLLGGCGGGASDDAPAEGRAKVPPPAPQDGDLLPDLRIVPTTEIDVVEGAKDERLLRFNTSVANVGEGSLALQLPREDGGSPKQLVDRVGGSERLQRIDATMSYDPRPTHRHVHLGEFVRFELRSVDPESDGESKLLGHAFKVGFILRNNAEYNPLIEAISRDPSVDPASVPEQFDGELGDRSDRDERNGHPVQRLGRGWTDIYGPDREGQQVDISGLEPGIYELVQEVDPGHRLLLGGRDDDVARRYLVLHADGSAAGCPSVRDCAALIPS